MAQQVNLCLPILRKQQTPFTGLALVQAWLVILLLGGALGTAWVWNLKQASDSLNATLAAQHAELEGLRAAMAKNQEGATPAKTAADKALLARRAELEQREVVLDALRQGHFEPGMGHAARLQLVARTIAPEAWVTLITADNRALEVVGFTLEPAALTPWVNRLSESPLLQGQALSTVKVDRVKPDVPMPAAIATGAVAGAAVTQALKPAIWAFALLSTMAPPISAAGGKP
jgi:hypothetical protein